MLLGCGESRQSATAPEAKPAEPVAEANKTEPPTPKAPDISIHDAAKDGNIKVVKQHLTAGADVNASDPRGWFPLHNVGRGGHKEIAELLLSNGADVNVKKDDGRTPLDFSIKFKNTEITDLLRKHGAKTMEIQSLREMIIPNYQCNR